MRSYKDHLIKSDSSIKNALKKLNFLAKDAILFVINNNNQLLGSITDGDIRRGFLKGNKLDGNIDGLYRKDPKFISKEDFDLQKIITLRELNYKIFPVVDNQNVIINVVNFRKLKSYLPLDTVIMAGGKGIRLMPLTSNIPKPLLNVGEKPIIQHNIDRILSFGIQNLWISINYLGDLIERHINNNTNKNINVNFIKEDKPMGTIGSLSKVNNFVHDYILLTNSDIITNLDYEQFFLNFVQQNADISVATVPYNVSIPYGVLESSNGHIISLKEKPTYTYYSNAGIYLIKKEILKYLPKNSFFNSTDLIELLIKKKKKVISYPMSCYWVDIGQHQDYEKANKEIKNIKF